MWRAYSREDSILRPDDKALPYRRRQGEKKTAVFWGQRKLALSLLSFINLHWDGEKVPKPIFVYAGAAPGKNINFLAKLYPQITWHLYDPGPIKFKVSRELNNVFIYRQYFTDETAQQWADRDDVYFLSDIRTVNRHKYAKKYGDSALEHVERDIWQDMLRQQRWVQIIKAQAAWLKFHLPYSGVTFSDEIYASKGVVPYLIGHVYKQPWASNTSTETRLVIPRELLQPTIDSPDREPSELLSVSYPLRDWSISNYEDQMFHHNAVTREDNRYYNPFDPDQKESPVFPPELDNQWDSLTEVTIFNDYLTKVNVPAGNRLTSIQRLSSLLTKMISNPEQLLSLSFLRGHPYHLKSRSH